MIDLETWVKRLLDSCREKYCHVQLLPLPGSRILGGTLPLGVLHEDQFIAPSRMVRLLDQLLGNDWYPPCIDLRRTGIDFTRLPLSAVHEKVNDLLRDRRFIMQDFPYEFNLQFVRWLHYDGFRFWSVRLGCEGEPLPGINLRGKVSIEKTHLLNAFAPPGTIERQAFDTTVKLMDRLVYLQAEITNIRSRLADVEAEFTAALA